MKGGSYIFNLTETDIKFVKLFYDSNMNQRLTANLMDCTTSNVTYYINKINKKVYPLDIRVMKDLLIIVESIDKSVSKLLERSIR